MLKPRRSLSRQVRTVRNAISSIIGALDRLAPVLAAAGAGQGGTPTARRRKLRLSPERRAALKEQGQYMGYLRGLKPRQKTQVKALRVTKGIRAALRLAQKLAKR
jgi:hypothetical protein